MLRTRCLHCESSRERTEDFHDVSVPVRLEKQESDEEGKLAHSILATPIGVGKTCSECLAPPIVVVHLGTSEHQFSTHFLHFTIL